MPATSIRHCSPKTLAKRLDIQKTPEHSMRRRCSPRSKGKTVDVGICEFWCILFSLNEQLPKTQKMTDAEIERQIAKEFPDRPCTLSLKSRKTTVQHYRHLYNTGKLHRDYPTSKSNRYDDKGNQIA